MNSYELSRNFWDWAYENPDKIKPIHSAIFFFAVEQCNRLGWKEKFGLPSHFAMEAIGLKNWRTYSKGLNDLVEFGFIIMIEQSKNQYTSNIIALVKNTKAHAKALDKAMHRHGQKQSQSTYQGTVSIDKPRTTKQLNQEQLNHLDSDFDIFWLKYDKKVDKAKCKKKWSQIKETDRQEILRHLPKYVQATPQKQYRKNPLTYLNGQTWKDEHLPIQAQKEKSSAKKEKPSMMEQLRKLQSQ